ncbi:MAG: putative C-S lyase [Clostridiales bacterium]|nr:putative C-S lyase [Clostridiales bacterium]
MTYDFDEVIDRQGTNSVKWDYRKDAFGRDDVLPMWVADMDFESPPEVKRAILKYASKGVYAYFRRPATYYSSIIDWVSDRHGWNIDRDWIVSTRGVINAINLAVLSYTSPRDKILIQTPVYSPFYSAVKNNNRELILNSLIEKDGYYTMDFEDLEYKLKDGVKMIILCNPHNPVGRVWNLEELKRLEGLCKEYDVVLISDEIHSDIIYDGHRHIPIASLSSDIARRTVTCISASKTFNIAGLDESVIIISNSKLRERFIQTMEGAGIGGGNIFGTMATEAAYSYGVNWLEDLLIYFQGNLKYLNKRIKESRAPVRFHMPEGTYLVWLDFRDMGICGDDLTKFLIDEARLGLNDGRGFGEEGDGYMRMNIACPRSTLRDGVNRLLTAISRI